VALFTNSIGHMAMNVLRERKVPVKKLFDKTFVSSDIHLAKPDKNAYAYVLRKLKVKPEEALMVDDRRENIAGVERLGMKGLVFKDAKKFQLDIKKFDLT
jgi:HAD superfamily hydrolase (TIGR01509 family)